MILVCKGVAKDHPVKRSVVSMARNPSSYVLTLPSVVAIGTVGMKISTVLLIW